MDWLRTFVPALVAGVVTVLLTPVVQQLAIRLKVVDLPGGRKQHSGPVPRLGGIAIAGGIVISLGPSLVLLSGSRPLGLMPSEMLWFSIALLVIFVLGLADDITPIGPVPKLLAQLIAASILVVVLDWQFTALRLPWEGRLMIGGVAPVLSVLWVIGVTNAINLIDGLDGLAAGIVAIISSSLLVLALLHGKPETVIVTSCVAGACLGFLRHNWRPAKIFMGDSGSLTLGFVLAAITLRTSSKASAAVAILVPLLALGLPVIDTLLVMWYRFLRGHPTLGRLAGVLHGDRTHLHHLLLETRTDRSRVMFTLYGLAVAFCLMAIAVAASSSWRLGIAFLLVEFAVVLVIRRAGLNSVARQLADERLARLDDNGDVEPDLQSIRRDVAAPLSPSLDTENTAIEKPT